MTPWTVACQAPLSVGFPRLEYWSGLPFPLPPGGSSPPRDLTEVSCIAGWFLTAEPPGQPPATHTHVSIVPQTSLPSSVALNLNQVLFKTVLAIVPVVNGFTNFLYHSCQSLGVLNMLLLPTVDDYCLAPVLLASNKTIAACYVVVSNISVVKSPVWWLISYSILYSKCLLNWM